MLADKLDVQTWLAEDRITVTDDLIQKPLVDAQRVIRGQLSGVFTVATIMSWDTPADTPEQIRAIAGRLTAAYVYRKIYSQEGLTVPAYAIELYNEAIGMLSQIKEGTLTVVDSGGNPIENSGSVLSFLPNDDNPMFRIGQTFA